MAKIKTHVNDCKRLIGYGFKKVHKHLDEYANIYPIKLKGEYHRKYRHTEKHINEMKNRFSEIEILAAKIHLIRDYEIYILNKPFYEVKLEEIDILWEKCKIYLHK
jgi:hypothetical protein